MTFSPRSVLILPGILMMIVSCGRSPLPVELPEEQLPISAENPFPHSKWVSLEEDGDSLRMEFTDAMVTLFKRRPGTPCWVHRGHVPFRVENGELKTTVLDGAYPCLPFHYNGGVLTFPTFSGDKRVWFFVTGFPADMPVCP